MKKQLINLEKNITVGVPEIDEQHGRLVNLIGSLSGMCRKRERVPDINFAMMIKQNMYFINFHINYEEKLMEETVYPGLEEHKNFHGNFFKDFLKHIRAFESRDRFVPENLPGFLNEWLALHLLMDRDMGLHIKKSGYPAA